MLSELPYGSTVQVRGTVHVLPKSFRIADLLHVLKKSHALTLDEVMLRAARDRLYITSRAVEVVTKSASSSCRVVAAPGTPVNRKGAKRQRRSRGRGPPPIALTGIDACEFRDTCRDRAGRCAARPHLTPPRHSSLRLPSQLTDRSSASWW